MIEWFWEVVWIVWAFLQKVAFSGSSGGSLIACLGMYCDGGWGKHGKVWNEWRINIMITILFKVYEQLTDWCDFLESWLMSKPPETEEHLPDMTFWFWHFLETGTYLDGVSGTILRLGILYQKFTGRLAENEQISRTSARKNHPTVQGGWVGRQSMPSVIEVRTGLWAEGTWCVRLHCGTAARLLLEERIGGRVVAFWMGDLWMFGLMGRVFLNLSKVPGRQTK